MQIDTKNMSQNPSSFKQSSRDFIIQVMVFYASTLSEMFLRTAIQYNHLILRLIDEKYLSLHWTFWNFSKGHIEMTKIREG